MKKCKLVGIGNKFTSFEKEYVNIHVCFEHPKVNGCVATSFKCLTSLLPDDLRVNDLIEVDSYPYRTKKNEWIEIVRSVSKVN